MIDNYDLWKEYDARQEEALARQPKCYECNEHIQDETCYEIDVNLVCKSCLRENHMRFTDRYL